MRLSLLPCLGLALLVLAGCDATDDYPLSREERHAFESEINAAVRAVEAAIGAARADDLAACRVVVVDTDGCGAPATFRAYSATEGDSLEIHRLAARADSLSHAYSRAIGIEKPCVNAEPPALVLEGGRCRFEPRAIAD